MPRARKTEVYTMRMTKDVKMYVNRNKHTSELIHEYLEKLIKKEKDATRTNTRKAVSA
jgi:hypothetical protein